MSAAAAPTPGDPTVTATASGIPSLDEAVEGAFTSIKEEVRSKLEAFHTTEATRRADLTAKLQAVINKLKAIVPAPEPAALSLDDILQKVKKDMPVTADETKNVDKLIEVIESARSMGEHSGIGEEIIISSVLAHVMANDDDTRTKIRDTVVAKISELAATPGVAELAHDDVMRQIADAAVNAIEPTTSHPNPRMLFPHMTTATASTPPVSSAPAPAPARYIPPAPPSPFASSKRKTDAFFKL